MTSSPGKYRFPWREGNHFRLLADGGAFFPAMLEAVAAARRHVLAEFYLVESGRTAERFIDALLAAVERGVAVYLLLDALGSHGLEVADRMRLVDGGVHMRWHNPLDLPGLRRGLHRDHRKLLLIDGERAYVGGMGLSDELDPRVAGASAWRDTAVEIVGPCVADWQRLFVRHWLRWAGRPPEIAEADAAAAGTQRGRVVRTGGGVPSEINRSAVGHIRRACRRVWLATAYFVPSWKLRRALRRAARRGVEVRLLVPGAFHDHPAVGHAGRRFYARLLRHGVHIHEYRPRFLHQKVLLCDDWVSLGSSNLDRLTLRWTLEANQEVEDAAFAAEVAAMLERDFADSVEVDAKGWGRRGRLGRALEWFWGRVDAWFDRYHRDGGPP